MALMKCETCGTAVRSRFEDGKIVRGHRDPAQDSHPFLPAPSPWQRAYEFARDVARVAEEAAQDFAEKYADYVLYVADYNMTRSPEREPLPAAQLWANWNR